MIGLDTGTADRGEIFLANQSESSVVSVAIQFSCDNQRNDSKYLSLLSSLFYELLKT